MYPKGLNGGLEPVQTSLSEPPIWSMDKLGKPAHEPSFLLVDLTQVTPGDHMPKVTAPYRALTPPSPPKTASHIRMAKDVQELLSHAMLGTSSHTLGDSPKEANISILGGSILNQSRRSTEGSNYFTRHHHSWTHLMTLCQAAIHPLQP